MLYKIENKVYVRTNMHYTEVRFVKNKNGEVILKPTKNHIPLENKDKAKDISYADALREYENKVKVVVAKEDFEKKNFKKSDKNE